MGGALPGGHRVSERAELEALGATALQEVIAGKVEALVEAAREAGRCLMLDPDLLGTPGGMAVAAITDVCCALRLAIDDPDRGDALILEMQEATDAVLERHLPLGEMRRAVGL